MSLFVDIHVLSAVGPNNLNRDDRGFPKTIEFGGRTRHRLSSQSQKYAVRGDFIDTYGDELTSLRSRSIPQLIALRLRDGDPSLSESEARELAGRTMAYMNGTPAKIKEAVNAANKDIKDAKGDYVPVLSATFQISDEQARNFASVVNDARANGVDFSDPKNASNKELYGKLHDSIRERSTADVLLFGRMLAVNTDLSTDATAQVAHAVGVSEYAGDVDMFIAADEISTRNSELADAVRKTRGKVPNGADMLETKGISAGTLYRYANVNATALAEAAGSKDDAAEIIGRFIKSFSTVLPGGAQNSHAARAPFNTLVVTVRSTAPMSLVGAFEVPVDNAKEATDALASFASRTADMYGEPVGDKVFALTAFERDELVDTLGADAAVTSLPGLVDAVTEHIKES